MVCGHGTSSSKSGASAPHTQDDWGSESATIESSENDECDDVIDMVTFNSLDANITQQKCSSERHVGLTITLTISKRTFREHNGSRGALPILQKTTSVS